MRDTRRSRIVLAILVLVSITLIVFDLRGEVNPQVFQLPPVASFGHRLVLDLYPANPVDPLMALLEREEARRVVEAPEGMSSPALVPRESPRVEVPRGRRSRRIVIAIDPGHGGEDPGAVGRRGTYEKHVVLAISRKLKRVLESDPNIRVVLTRDDDYFVPLSSEVTATTLAEAQKQGAVFAYGAFLSVIINFLIIAFVLFQLVKISNQMRKAEPPPPAPGPTRTEELLAEIRDALKSRGQG